MEAVQHPVMENIISLTLEVIALLTGEGYDVVRKRGDGGAPNIHIPAAPAGARRGPALQLMNFPLTRDIENDKKILEATNKIIHMLTGEVWKFLGYAASCEDSAVQEAPPTSCQDSPECPQTQATCIEIKREFMSCPEGGLQHDNHSGPIKSINDVTEHVCREGRDVTLCTQQQYTMMEHAACVEGEPPLQGEQTSNPKDYYPLKDLVQPAVNHTKDELAAAKELSPDPTVCAQYSSRIKEELCCEELIPPTEKDAQPPKQDEAIAHEERESTNLYVQMDYTVPDTDEDSGPDTNVKRKVTASRPAAEYDERIFTHPFSAEITLTIDKTHECPECHKSFTRNSDLLKHQKVHQRGQSITCPECGKCFTKNSMYVRHQRSHTGEKPFSCPDCGKSFAVGAHLATHQRIHTGEKPFACADCGKSFNQKASLIKHRRTHTGEKPFVCTSCGKCFTSSTNLTLHTRVHTGEKPYSCSVCGKSFRSSPNLISHQRIHTGEKPYSCNVCGKFFTNSSVLVRHHRTHTGEKPFLCSECGKRFTRNSQLVKHQLIHLGQRPYASK